MRAHISLMIPKMRWADSALWATIAHTRFERSRQSLRNSPQIRVVKPTWRGLRMMSRELRDP